MKNTVVAAAFLAFAGTTSQAGGLLDELTESEVVAPIAVEEDDDGLSPWIIAAIAAGLIAAAAAGSSGGGS